MRSWPELGRGCYVPDRRGRGYADSLGRTGSAPVVVAVVEELVGVVIVGVVIVGRVMGVSSAAWRGP